MSEVVVVAIARCAPGEEAKAEALLRSVIAPTHAEDGCIAYALHRDVTDPTRFVYVERWASRAALDAHAASAHIADFRTKMREVSAGPPEVLILDALPDGDPSKGSLR